MSNKIRFPRLLLLLVTATALLASCSNQAPPRTELQQDAGMVNLSIALEGAELSQQELTQFGVPYEPTSGQLAVGEVHVHVRDAGGNAITFNIENGAYLAAPGGTDSYIMLSAGTASGGIASADVTLPAVGDPYTFESSAYRDGAAGPGESVIAHHSLIQEVSVHDHVQVMLASVLGDAVLFPRFPTNLATPGALLDLMLVVTANGYDTYLDDHLQVPIGDFTAEYTAVTGATAVTSSNRGIRLNVDVTCSSAVTVEGEVTGILATGGTFAMGTLDISGSGGYELACPTTSGNITADLESPTVTIDSYDPATGIVTGSADDNFGIAKVQLFDGPVLLASTDEDELGGDVAEITFALGTTNFSTALTTPPLGPLEAVALDHSGNEAAATLDTLYVALGGTGDGTQADPFGSIANAIAAAGPGYTIQVEPGIYSADGLITIDKPFLTLEGNGAQVERFLIEAPHTTVRNFRVDYDGAARFNGVEVSATNVVLENLDIQGYRSGTGGGFDALHQGVIITGNTTANGFRMIGGSISGFTLGLVAEHRNSDAQFDDVVIEGVTFSDIRTKGIYFDTLSNALIKDVTLTNVGNYGLNNTSGNPGASGVGIDLFLRTGTFENITFDGVVIDNSGLSNEEDPTAPPRAISRAIRVTAVDFPGLPLDSGENAATLDGLEFRDVTITTGATYGIFIGDSIDLTPTPTNVTFTGSVITAGAYAVALYSAADVDATDSGNSFSGGTMDVLDGDTALLGAGTVLR